MRPEKVLGSTGTSRSRAFHVGRADVFHILSHPKASADSDGDPDSVLPKIPATSLRCAFRNAPQRNAHKHLVLEMTDHADK